MELSRKTYKMYHKYDYIADFIEIYTDFGVELRIEIKPEVNLTQFKYIDLKVLQKDRVLNDKAVRFWIDNRVTPATQDGIEDKLKNWGLSEYNQLAIMHKTLGICGDDYYWIKFNPKADFDTCHTRSPKFKRILGD